MVKVISSGFKFFTSKSGVEKSRLKRLFVVQWISVEKVQMQIIPWIEKLLIKS